jgi:hypothetical protein
MFMINDVKTRVYKMFLFRNGMYVNLNSKHILRGKNVYSFWNF